jgi:hypothetical protein
MDKQRGGAFTVSGYIALALVALAIVEAALIRHLYTHRVIQMHVHVADVELPGMQIHGDPNRDYYVTHAFPNKNVSCCDAFNTICYTKI